MIEADEYALRHLPAHLAAGGRVDRLYLLARNERFSGQQSTHFASEPRLAVTAQRFALLEAATRDDPVPIAEFTLRHLVGLFELSHESPLVAVRTGALLRAWRLADVPDSHDRSLWYLLLAWDLAERGEADASERTLIRLLGVQPTVIPGGRYADQENWKNAFARIFIEMLERHAAAALPEVKTRLLPEGGYEELTVSGGPPKEYSWRDEENALIENVLRDAQSGDIGAARQTLDEMHVAGYGFRTRAYSYVIKALVQSGHGLAAVELAAEGLRPIHEYERLTVARVGALAELAVEVARLDSGLAMDLLQRGIALASGLEDRQLKFEACHELACARLKVVGMFDLQEFIRTVIGSDDEPARGPIGVSLCRLLAESDRVEAALQLAEELPEPFWFTSFRNEAYQAISRARAAIGDLQQAVTVADRITLYTWERTVEGVSLAARAGALAGIVVASAGAGQTSEAERAYAEIIANGSGTEGALEEWHGWLHEAFSALLLHFFETGRGDKLDDLTRGEENLISGPDAASIGRAARFIGDGNRDAAVTQLLDIGDPTWRGKALCKLAQRASRSGSGEVLGLARLAFECATEEEYSAARLHLLGEISALIESLGDAEVESNVTGLFDHVAAGLTGDRTASLSLALRTSLAYWKPSQLQGLLAEAAEWPSAAYEACVLLARRYRGTETKIAQLVLQIDARRLSRLAGRAVDVLPERG